MGEYGRMTPASEKGAVKPVRLTVRAVIASTLGVAVWFVLIFLFLIFSSSKLNLFQELIVMVYSLLVTAFLIGTTWFGLRNRPDNLKQKSQENDWAMYSANNNVKVWSTGFRRAILMQRNSVESETKLPGYSDEFQGKSLDRNRLRFAN